MFWDIVIVAGVFWIIMSFFSYLQTVQIKNIFKMLEPSGKVYFGRDGGMFFTRYYAFAAVDASGTIVDARSLKASRLVTLAKILPFDEIIGKDLENLHIHSLALDRYMVRATENLISNFKKIGKKRKK